MPRSSEYYTDAEIVTAQVPKTFLPVAIPVGAESQRGDQPCGAGQAACHPEPEQEKTLEEGDNIGPLYCQ